MLNSMIGQKLAETASMDCQAPTVKERVQSQIEELERRLAAQKELSELLEKHPEIERALTLLGNT